jgi:hypothetical protein
MSDMASFNAVIGSRGSGKAILFTNFGSDGDGWANVWTLFDGVSSSGRR